MHLFAFVYINIYRKSIQICINMYFIYLYIDTLYTYILIYVYYSIYVWGEALQCYWGSLGALLGVALHGQHGLVEVEIQDKMPTAEERV